MERSIIAPQEGITALERCRKPIIVAMHGAVIGGGIDLATAGDIRYCSADTFFSIAEVKVGLAADVGTLQRLPKVVGNDSVVRELAFTGRRMDAEEARHLGLISKVLPNKTECWNAARATAMEIAKLSPIAILGTKISLTYSRDHTTQEGLDHIRMWNSTMLQSEDFAKAVQAQLKKQQAIFSNL
jgi:delta(3,5)-delta(2,4)-dienoyl-CoA isomerase